MHRSSLNTRRLFLLAACLILLGGFALRLLNLLTLPLFVDEAGHIYRAQRMILQDVPFLGADHNKWMYPALLRTLQPLGPEGPWLARGVSVLWASLTLACAIRLGKTLDQPLTGLLAGALYAVMPLATWHERQALVDPMLAAFTALSTCLAVTIALKPKPWLGGLLALSLAGAYITKLAAVPFLALPLITPLALTLAGRVPQLRRALIISAAGLIVALGLIWGFGAVVEAAGYAPKGSHSASANNIMLFDLDSERTRAQLSINAADYAETLFLYGGPALLIACALALLWAAQGTRRWEILLLLLPAFAFAALPLVARPVTGEARNPPRYFLTQAAPMAVLAALSARILWDQLRPRPALMRAGLGGMAALYLIPALIFNGFVLVQPAQARLTAVDRDQYLSPSGGYARTDAAYEVLRLWRQQPGTRFNLLAPSFDTLWFNAYLGPRVGAFEVLELKGDLANAQRGRVARYLINGERVFYLERAGRDFPPAPHDALINPIGEYTFEGRLYRLYEVQQAGGQMAAYAYTELGHDPRFMATDYDALAAALAADASPRRVLVYPPTHAAMLAERSPLDVQPLPLTVWPFDAALLQAALDDALAGAQAGPLEVVLVNQAESDPQRLVQTALERRLYRMGPPDWFGLLGRTRYAFTPADPALQPVGAVFEDAIALQSCGLGAAEGGELLLMRCTWQAEALVADPFVVFVHVVDAAGNLAAQYDSQPGGGLFPLTSWQPGQPVEDRLAISLPASLASADYTVRIGLYNLASGLRLRVTQGGSGDYVPLAGP